MSDLNASVDMFEDSSNSEGLSWRGIPLDNVRPKHICTYPAVRSTPNHTVLFKLPIPDDGPLEPHPSRPADKWDADHIRMPHSPESLFPVSENVLKPRWNLIKKAFAKPIRTSEELEQAILSYNIPSANDSSFEALHKFFNETLLEEETSFFFDNLMPNIAKLALEIEDKFRGGLPILKKGANKSISMSQVQAAILLANAFLCTFPRRNSPSPQSNLPSINFNGLFQQGSLASVQQKLKCFTNYFRRVLKKRPTGVVTYSRRCLKPSELPNWSESEAKLSPLYIDSSGTIEGNEGGMMEMDFAHKLVGGGVLGRGCVQEEIRFLICPELIVARLFSEKLADTEALIITGCERFSSYDGYGQSFTWSGNFDDSTRPRDSYRRLNTIVVAIDALYNFRFADQFKLETVTREINKAYAGFSFGAEGGIATGNWGCGVYKGDPLFKFLLQLMAASVSAKAMAYFTFGDDELRDSLFKMHQFLVEKRVHVGALWQLITTYLESTAKGKSGHRLYEFIYNQLNSGEENSNAMEVDGEDTVDFSSHKRKCTPDSNCNTNKSNEAASGTQSKTKGSPKAGTSGMFAKLSVDSPTRTNSLKNSKSKSSKTVDGSVLSRELNDEKRATTKKSSSTPEKLSEASHSLDDSVDDAFVANISDQPVSANCEPVNAETCSLQTAEGRKKCLDSDQERWGAYQAAMSKFSNETKIDQRSPESPKSPSSKTKRGSMKRKISDYFPKSTP